MKTKIFFVFAMFIVVLSVDPGISLATDTSHLVPFKTVDQGEISFYRYDDPGFAGRDMHIKDLSTWETFWKEHTAGLSPQPALPKINFKKEAVIVTILGFQTSGGGPSITILDVGTDNDSKRLHILIEDDETPGPLDVITNPYHIIKLRKVNARSVVFEHQRP